MARIALPIPVLLVVLLLATPAVGDGACASGGAGCSDESCPSGVAGCHEEHDPTINTLLQVHLETTATLTKQAKEEEGQEGYAIADIKRTAGEGTERGDAGGTGADQSVDGDQEAKETHHQIEEVGAEALANGDVCEGLVPLQSCKFALSYPKSEHIEICKDGRVGSYKCKWNDVECSGEGDKRYCPGGGWCGKGADICTRSTTRQCKDLTMLSWCGEATDKDECQKSYAGTYECEWTAKYHPQMAPAEYKCAQTSWQCEIKKWWR